MLFNLCIWAPYTNVHQILGSVDLAVLTERLIKLWRTSIAERSIALHTLQVLVITKAQPTFAGGSARSCELGV